MKDFKLLWQACVLAIMLFSSLLQELMKQLNVIQVSRNEITILPLLLCYNLAKGHKHLICAGSFFKTCS